MSFENKFHRTSDGSRLSFGQSAAENVKILSTRGTIWPCTACIRAVEATNHGTALQRSIRSATARAISCSITKPTVYTNSNNVILWPSAGLTAGHDTSPFISTSVLAKTPESAPGRNRVRVRSPLLRLRNPSKNGTERWQDNVPGCGGGGPGLVIRGTQTHGTV